MKRIATNTHGVALLICNQTPFHSLHRISLCTQSSAMAPCTIDTVSVLCAWSPDDLAGVPTC